MSDLSPSPRVPLLLPLKSLGFTVTELLTVVAIAGVLAAMALPGLAGSIERARLKSAAEAIASDLDLARLETGKRNTNLQVSFRAGGEWCYGIHTGPCDCSVAGSCSIKSVTGTDIGRGVTLGSALFSESNATTFNRIRGTARAGHVSLQSNAGDSLQVVVSTRGRVRICSPSHSLPGYPSC